MKKDIMVIRESIGLIVSMLTSRKVKVTQRGTNAYVQYHPKSGEIMALNIPYIPDDASDEFIAAIQGFLDHEVGHILFSDFEALKEATKAGKRVANIANLIEDVYVERRMAEAFTGSGLNLENVRRFYLEKIARVKIEAALAKGNIEEARGYATAAAFRGWGGQASAMDFIREPKIAELIAPVAEKLGETMELIGHCKNSMECVELAKVCKKKLEHVEKPPAPPPIPPVPGPTEKPEPKSAPEPKEEEPESDDDHEPGEGDDGTTSVETDDDAETDGRGEGEKPDDAESGESGGSEPPPAIDDEPTPEDADDAPDPDDEPDADGSGASGEGSSDEPPEFDPEAPPEFEDGAAPEPEAAPESPKGDSGDGGEEPLEGDDSDLGERGEVKSSTGMSTEEAPLEEEPELDPIGELFDEERDFDSEMEKALSAAAEREVEDSSYAVFSTEWDVIAPAPLSRHSDAVSRMDASIRDKVGVIQKHLERAIAAQAKKAWSPGQRRGRIAPGSLFKTSVGEDRVFRKRFETKAKNTAVSLLIDCSGSMGGGSIQIAGSAAYALATVLERIKVNYEVLGFTSKDSREMQQMMELDARTHGKSIYDMGWSRIEALHIPIFKPFTGRLDTENKSRIAKLVCDPSGLVQNMDGESVQIAGHRLLQQRAERHVLIVLSDGEPACVAGRGLDAHLKKTVAGLTKASVEVIGIGIETSVVKRFYPKHVVLHSADDLPTSVMAEITKLLV